MAQHISRKDLKKDEIRETLVSGVESVASHQQALWMVIAAALVVALAVFGWNTYAARQTAKASLALDDALKIFQARIRTAGATLVASGTGAAAIEGADYSLPVPAPTLPLLAPILSVVPGQLFALALARAKGLDPDLPRGLSKVTLAR